MSADPLADSGSAPAADDLRVEWRTALAIAAGLICLFTVQNSVTTPVVRPDQTFGDVFVRQVIVWGVWLPLLPLIVANAKRARASRPLTAWIVVRQMYTATWIALLHGATSDT